MQYNFKVVNDNMVCDKREMPLTGNVNTYRCVFDIECDIPNLLWFCVFERDGKAYVQPILENECFIPHEVLVSEGKIKIGCYATNLKEDDFKRISTNWVFFNSLEGAYSDAAIPEVPEPDVWETLVLKCVPIIGENGNWFIYDISTMQYADSGVKASGKDGEDGHTPKKGVDYFTEEDTAEIVAEVSNTVMPNDFELIASGETTEEVNSIVITQDNDGNPFELCDRITIYSMCPRAAETSNLMYNLNGLVAGLITNALTTSGKRYHRATAIYSGKKWDCYCQNADGEAANGAVSSRDRFSAVDAPNVNAIKIAVSKADIVLPIGFKYEIYGRRVKK